MAVIACVDLDPFLVGLVRRVRPDDEVVDVTAGQLGRTRRRRYTAMVMSAHTASEIGLEGARFAERTVLVTGPRDGRVPPAHPGPVVRRPVEATALRQALTRVVSSGRWAALRGRLSWSDDSPTADLIFAVVRVAVAAGAAALAVGGLTSGPPTVLVVGLLLWCILRLWVRGITVGLVAVDAVLAGVILVAGADPGSPYILFAAVAAAEVGYAFPSRVGASLVGVATIAGLVPLALGMREGTASTSDLIGWGALIPLSGVVGVLGHRLRSGRETSNLKMLQDLHATLDRLAKQAQGAAGTLDVGSVVEQTMATVREEPGVRAGALLLGDGRVLDVVGAFGLSGEPPPRIVTTPARRDPGLPGELTSLFPEGSLFLAPLDAMGVQRGALVVVVDQARNQREADAQLRTMATEVAVAIDNARLFEGIQDLTIDEERRRLARDLHDGVIQSLVHVRFELDLVGRLVDTHQNEEIKRLRDVVGQAVDEVRATVNDLRSVRLSAGLGTALLSVAREYEGPGRRVVVDAAPVDAITPEAELQLLRIAQEAISNAVRHGRSSLVYVRLWEDRDEVHLQVLDDGVGMADALADAARGVGLRAMQERADLLGAALDLTPGMNGGSCVQVDVPLGRMRR